MTVCDAEGCTRRATQVGEVPLPIEPLELRLCDEHVEALRAGKARGLSQRTGWRNDGARPQVTFADEPHR
ncbi:hypothetical protein DQ239_14850 [Blastococcus sp. TF02-09]|uniref:hypothetical protein n=1 Tax=Blastococcus sp. TF02-09 TaxID=2250576 RepID=UPI000DEADDCF|nr:hypothetical protein [Blastococcus sp. TF02-9]RBY76257.1 hypothetical protein DQ239_14850 [Blastococcus sp. TF02-9]